MKESLVDRPPTIGDLRRQGVVSLKVRCARPCKRIGNLTLDTLRLPDDAIFRQIPRLRRLRCQACDRCDPDIEPIWPTSPPAIGSMDTQTAQWVVVMNEGGRELTSSSLWSREHALRFVRDQIEASVEVARIETPAATIEADEIAAWLADDRTR